MDVRRRLEREVAGALHAAGRSLPFRVLEPRSHSLTVDLGDADLGVEPRPLEQASLQLGANSFDLGRCLWIPDRTGHRRKGDPPAPLHRGRLVPLDQLLDFDTLLVDGSVLTLTQRLAQVGLLLGRKGDVRPSFRAFTSDLTFDLQVYRSLFDGIDRALAGEPPEATARVHELALAEGFEEVSRFLDERLALLEEETRGLSRHEHECHGYYFRKQLWDFILLAPFMRRTNLKPRGYAGDSEMMRMIYERSFCGETLFGKMLHRHPIEHNGSQAVRNRREMVRNEVAAARQAHGSSRLAVLSVACGPAWEVRDLLATADDIDRFSFTLLDQDEEALDEARRGIAQLAASLGQEPTVRYERESVRTMLRSPDLAARLGGADFVYSMGLFDYLVDPVAKAVLDRMYELLAPGGTLLVGNFHPKNRSRVYMEYWLDWVLNYRDEEALAALAKGLVGGEIEILDEPAGCQIFMRVRKHA